MKKKTSSQRQLKTLLVCVAESEKGFNSTRRHLDRLYLCGFISVQEEMTAFTQLIPPQNWLQQLLSLPKTRVACGNCCWRSPVSVLLLEKAVVITKASFLYKHIQSSRAGGVFSATTALLPCKAARTLSIWGKRVPVLPTSMLPKKQLCNSSDKASKKQQQGSTWDERKGNV